MKPLKYFAIVLYSALMLAGIYQYFNLYKVMVLAGDLEKTELFVVPLRLLILSIISLVGLILLVISISIDNKLDKIQYNLIRLITVCILIIYIPFGLFISIIFIITLSKWADKKIIWDHK